MPSAQALRKAANKKNVAKKQEKKRKHVLYGLYHWIISERLEAAISGFFRKVKAYLKFANKKDDKSQKSDKANVSGDAETNPNTNTKFKRIPVRREKLEYLRYAHPRIVQLVRMYEPSEYFLSGVRQKMIIERKAYGSEFTRNYQLAIHLYATAFFATFLETFVRNISAETWAEKIFKCTKYLTFYTFTLNTAYFLISLWCDMRNLNKLTLDLNETSKLRRVKNWLFRGFVMPLLLSEGALLMMCSYTNEKLQPADMAQPMGISMYLTTWLHYFLIAFAECYFVYRQYPGKDKAPMFMLISTSAYVFWICYLHGDNGKWPVPILDLVPTPYIYVVFAVIELFTFSMYYVARFLNGRWTTIDTYLIYMELYDHPT